MPQPRTLTAIASQDRFGDLNDRQRRLVEDAERAGCEWSLAPGDASVAIIKRAGDTTPSRLVISPSGMHGTGMHVALVDSTAAGALTISHTMARLLLRVDGDAR